MRKRQVGIIGQGTVGRSMRSVFGEDAVCLDIGSSAEGRRQLNQCEVAFICVPTPVARDGRCDVSIVESCVAWVRTPRIVIRSTVAPGTTEELAAKYGKRIVFQPEYLGETPGHPLADARKQGFIILGGPLEDCSAVADLYQRYFHSDMRFYYTSSRTAEMAKYMENAFLAAKVTFCNEFHDIAGAFGVDYNELREIWLADPRIGRDHTFVYPDNRGFGGKCLPKDVLAIFLAAKAQGCFPRLLDAILEINQQYRAADPEYTPYRREEPDAPS